MYDNTNESKLNVLRSKMEENNIAIYIISSYDFHMSSSISDYFKSIEYLTGYKELRCYMAITSFNAHIWVDNEMYKNAKEYFMDTEIIVHNADDYSDDIRNPKEFFSMVGKSFLENDIDETDSYIIGFDSRTFSFNFIDSIIESLGMSFDMGYFKFNGEIDLIGEIRHDRPDIPTSRIMIYDDKISPIEKCNLIRKDIYETTSESFGIIITSLEDICWLYNIRGTDIRGTLLSIAYAYITKEKAYIFIDKRKLDNESKRHFSKYNIEVRAYDEFYSFLGQANEKTAIIDGDKNNAAVILTIINDSNMLFIDRANLIEQHRIIKSPYEISGMRDAAKRDSVAMIKFLKWIDENKNEEIIEHDAGLKLSEFRKEIGAIAEYEHNNCLFKDRISYKRDAGNTEENKIHGNRVFVIKGGAYYKKGQAFSARTVFLGNATQNEKYFYTLTLKALFEIENIIFPDNIDDTHLDAILRKDIWKMQTDLYKTAGKGIGQNLSNAEGAIEISYIKERKPCILKERMTFNYTPSICEEGEPDAIFSNQIIVLRKDSNFLRTDNLTFIPIQKKYIDEKIAGKTLIKNINKYNKKILENMKEWLDEDDIDWLKKYIEA